MKEIDSILKDLGHRPFEIPKTRWAYYQEWNMALFLHWRVAYDSLRKIVPDSLELDRFHGDAYVSIVAFTMQKVRPRNLPSVHFISDFDEINVRTYVYRDNRKGVYFLNIEAGKPLSALIAKTLSGLPYETANIKRTDNRYRSVNPRKNYLLDTEFQPGEPLLDKTDLDKWLTERYCLYVNGNDIVFRYDIHHREWEVKQVEIKKLISNYEIGDIDLSGRPPDLIHYSDGVKVVAWKRTSAGTP